MFELSSIFVPVDHSTGSRAAFEIAQRVASAYRAPIHAAHVVPAMMRYMRGTLFPYAALGEDEIAMGSELRHNAAASLEQFLKLGDEDGEEAAEDSAAAPTLDVLLASQERGVVTALLERLQETTAELVVMGMTGESETTPGVMGAVAGRLLASTTRPTLFVRAVDRKRPIRKVVAALDMSDGEVSVYKAAVGFGLTLEASVTALSVIPSLSKHDVAGVLGHTLTYDRDAIKKRGKKDVGKIMARFRENSPIPFPLKEAADGLIERDVVLVGDVVGAVGRYVERNDIDLLVIGRRGSNKSRLPSNVGRTCAAIIANAPCYVLVVP